MIFTLIMFIVWIITIYEIYGSDKFKFEDDKKEKDLDDNK